MYNILLHDLKIKTLTKYCFSFVLIYKYCWHHLLNVWFGAVIKKLGAHLAEFLEDYFEEIHYSLCVTNNIGMDHDGYLQFCSEVPEVAN